MANTEAPVTDRPPQSRPDCCYSARGATAVVAKERRQRLVVERTATAGQLRAPIFANPWSTAHASAETTQMQYPADLTATLSSESCCS